jgi:hypothetical protein
MNKKVKVSASKAKAVAEKIKKYETLNPKMKTVLGGAGAAPGSPIFGRLSGYHSPEELPI